MFQNFTWGTKWFPAGIICMNWSDEIRNTRVSQVSSQNKKEQNIVMHIAANKRESNVLLKYHSVSWRHKDIWANR